MSFSPPIVDRVRGCEPLIVDEVTGAVDNHTITNCSRFGGDRVTIYGTASRLILLIDRSVDGFAASNRSWMSPHTGSSFGFSGASVIVGVSLATNVVHKNGSEHRELSFTLPGGVGLRQAILVLQGGDIRSSPAAVSYHQCAFGEYQSGRECLPCDAFGYSNTLDATRCVGCPEGFYPNRTSGATSCSACPRGKASASGQSSCSECGVGRAQPFEAQRACVVCPAGRFSANQTNVNCGTSRKRSRFC